VLPKEASYREMLIQFIPGDAYAVAHETPLGALLGGRGEERRGKPMRGALSSRPSAKTTRRVSASVLMSAALASRSTIGVDIPTLLK
jgi:hypothetical protein